MQQRLTQVRQCSLEESMILTNVSFSPFYPCPKTPVFNEKKLRHVTARYWTIHQVVSEASGLQNKLKKNKYLYTRVRKDLYFLETTRKTSLSWRGNLSPWRKKKFSNSKKHLLFKKKQGFWQARHMTTCPACVGLPALNLIQKPIIGAISSNKSARKIRFSCFWK